jgi:hypothetical protein
VFQNDETGAYACEIAYGTKSIKLHQRGGLDIIISNSSDIDEMGLHVATRFDLDPENRIVLEWCEPNFKAWSGYLSPKLGALTLEYQKDYAWLMAKRSGV